MRVLFCGSRDLTDSWRIWNELQRLALAHGAANVTIVHGAAPGADAITDYYARRMGFVVEPHKADWGRYKKAAGPIRNREMLATGVDQVLAFINKPLEESRGTLDMTTIAMEAGVPVTVIDS